MRRLLVLGVLLPCLHLPAMAQAVFRGDDFMVLFFPTPCEVPALVQILMKHGVAKRAAIIHEGLRIKACFIRDGDGDYFLLDELGNAGVIPAKSVQPGA